MENLSETFLSEEQQERQEKFVELLDIMSSISESFINSNDAYEVTDLIKDFKNKFESEGFELKDYLLGGVLLSSDNNLDESNYHDFDTEDGKIENFIRSLDKYQKEKIAA